MKNTEKIYWYFNRLKMMSCREVLYRIKERAYAFLQRAGLFRVNRPSEASITHTTNWLALEASADRTACVDFADSVLAGHVSVFNVQMYVRPSDRRWNRDPLTSRTAPLTYGPTIDVRSREEVGDIKYLWEQNRHHDISSLALAFKLTGDDAYLNEIRVLLESWFDQCRYLVGPNWSSGLELAIRLINWSVIWQSIGAERSELFKGASGKRFQASWLQSIFQHVHFIDRHYSKFSSANNHLIGEASGVFIATCTWPFWEEMSSWQMSAKNLLIDAVDQQIASDGVGHEQAFAYQQFVLDFLILSGLAGRVCGVDFPREYWQKIERMIEFIQNVMDVAGNVPMVGDADDGIVVRLSHEREFCPYKSLLATGALLFDRSDFAAKSGKVDDKTRYLLGRDRHSGLLGGAGAQKDTKKRQFSVGGYYILGQDFDTEKEVFLLIDAGPLGYLSIAAHGHADALAIYLSVSGREFLVDPGTYTYHGSPEMREYFRSTRAHNTVVIDDQDQSVQRGPFLWARHANANCTKFEFGEQSDFFQAEHDGYSRLPDPVVHQREIVRSGLNFEVVDTLRCKAGHSVERCWHFSEFCNVEIHGATVVAENRDIIVRLSAEEPSTHIVSLAGSENPIGGWVSRRFEKKKASTSVYFKDRIHGTTVLRTRIECQFS